MVPIEAFLPFFVRDQELFNLTIYQKFRQRTKMFRATFILYLRELFSKLQKLEICICDFLFFQVKW